MPIELDQSPEPEYSPASAKPRDQKLKNKIGNAIGRIAGPVILAGTAMVGPGLFVHYEINRTYGEKNYHSQNPEKLNKIDGAQIEPRTIAFRIVFYSSQTDVLNKAFYEFAQRKGSQDALATFEQVAFDHMVDGLILLKQSDPAQIEYEGKSGKRILVRIDNDSYNLNSRFEFQEAFSLSSLKLEGFYLEQNLKNNSSPQSEEEQKQRIWKNKLDQESLLWLKNQDLDVDMSQNSVLFANPTELAAWARNLKFIKEDLHLPLPKASFVGRRDYGGTFHEKVNLGPVQLLQPRVENSLNQGGNVDDLVHENGHYVASNGHQREFDQAMEAANKQYLAQVKDKKNVTFYTYKPDSRHEQFADFYRLYFDNGDYLREKIATLQKEDPAAAKIIQAGTDYFKNLYKKEFVKDGLTKQDLTPKVEKPETYSTGQLVKIVDKYTQLPGILLRSQPEAAARTDFAAVFDQDQVKIISGPYVTKRQVYDEKQNRYVLKDVNWWEVQITSQSFESYNKLGNLKSAGGFIEEKYLGEVFDTKPKTP